MWSIPFLNEPQAIQQKPLSLVYGSREETKQGTCVEHHVDDACAKASNAATCFGDCYCKRSTISRRKKIVDKKLQEFRKEAKKKTRVSHPRKHSEMLFTGEYSNLKLCDELIVFVFDAVYCMFA